MANVSVLNSTAQVSAKTVAICENDQTISGAWTFTGNMTLQGNLAVGNAVTDTVTFTATITSHLLFTDATYDIGASGATRPRDLFLSRNAVVGGTLSVAGNVVSNLTFTDATYDIGASGATRPRDLFLSRNAKVSGLAFLAASELTIATGAVTATAGYHRVDTEADAASDDLDTITAGTGVTEGFVLVLRAENVARVVTLTESGNMLLNGTYALSATDRTITLLYDGTNWRELARSFASSAPGGSDTQVQFNDSSAFGGDAGLVYNKTTDTLTLAGPLVISGAAAGQITFPASQNASAGVNVLDDYEEGTWTPTVVSSGGGGSAYSTQFGAYTKVGRLCFCTFRLVFTSDTLSAGTLTITGLPFTSATMTSAGGGELTTWTGIGTSITGMRLTVGSAVTVAALNYAAAAAASVTAATDAEVDADSVIEGVITYMTA